MASAYAMHLNAIVLLCRIWLTTLLPMLVCSVLATAVSNVQRLTSIIDVRAFNFRVSALRGLRLAGGSGQCAESGSGQWAEGSGQCAESGSEQWAVCGEWQWAVGRVQRVAGGSGQCAERKRPRRVFAWGANTRRSAREPILQRGAHTNHDRYSDDRQAHAAA